MIVLSIFLMTFFSIIAFIFKKQRFRFGFFRFMWNLVKNFIRFIWNLVIKLLWISLIIISIGFIWFGVIRDHTPPIVKFKIDSYINYFLNDVIGKGATIVDAYFEPSLNGTLLFKAKPNTTYKLQIDGCGLQKPLFPSYSALLNVCPDGKHLNSSEPFVETTHSIYKNFTFRFPNEPVDKAILFIDIKGKKRLSQIVGGALVTLRFNSTESGNVYLSLNIPQNVKPRIYGKWHVIVIKEK